MEITDVFVYFSSVYMTTFLKIKFTSYFPHLLTLKPDELYSEFIDIF